MQDVISEDEAAPRYYLVCNDCSPKLWFAAEVPPDVARCQNCGAKMDLIDTRPEWPEEL